MIGYTMVGTRDLERSRRFYAPLFTEMGLDPCWRDDQVSSWGKADDTTVPRFFTGYPFDGHPATVGNGTMTAFLIDSAGRIDRLHRIAMEHGGTDEGGPGFRPQYSETFYAAYVRDPDGNKLAFVCYDGKADA
jgi:catechol 2,3-dioxygenase-like lactoylglutathione lyase family enzyme